MAWAFSFDRVIIALPYLLQDVAHLVYPAALMQRPRIDRLDRCCQSRTAIGDDQLQVLALQSAAIQILQQPLPIGLALAPGAQKGQQLAGAVAAHPIGDQHLYALPSTGPAYP